MATINNTMRMKDAITPTLRAITRAMSSTLATMRNLDRESNNGMNSRNYNRAENDIRRANNKLIRMHNITRLVSDGQGRVTKGFESWQGKLVSLQAGIGLIKSGINAINKSSGIADSFTLSSARLKMINDGTMTNKQLQNEIFASANRSRGAYGEMAANIAKMGLLAKDTFSNNSELISFAEILNKSFVVGGASAQEMSAGTYQLTQALAAGKLQGDEFRSVMENAPMVADAIAKYTGKSKGQLKEMSSEGTITADIIKNAMLNAADDINGKFNKMPMTFEQSMTMVKNKALKAFQPLISAFSKFVQSKQFDSILNTTVNIIKILAKALLWVSTLISNIYDYVTKNWKDIYPILLLIAAGLGAVALANFIMGQSWLFNPATWVILGIVAAICVLIKILNAFGITNEQILQSVLSFWKGGFDFWTNAIGLVCYAVMKTYALVNNVIASIWNTIATFVEFFANVFTQPLETIGRYFFDLFNNILGIIQTVAGAIGSIFGQDWSSGLQNFRNDLEGLKKQTFGEAKVKINRMDQMNDNKAGQDAYNKVTGGIKGVADGIGKGVNNFTKGLSNLGKTNNTNSKLLKNFKKINVPKINNKGKGKVDVGSIDKPVKISDESIKALAKVAERAYTKKYVTNSPVININGNLSSPSEKNSILKELEKAITESMSVEPKGVY